jgi:hypothetical protein
MGDYYTIITEDIVPGHLAYAGDIGLIQANIQASESQLICDNFGDGYVLDDEENVYLMTPVGTGDEQIDQMNKPSQYLSFRGMNDVYVRQTIEIEKSSVESIKVYVKNTSGDPQVLHGELRTTETETIDSELISSYEITIPASQTAAGFFSFLFNVHHLIRDNYYLVIKYATGIEIGVDTAGEYNKTFATSTNGVQYEQETKDLWFEEKYATDLTYDIVDGTAVVHGEKIQNADTHVTIADRSLYGDRIDIITMDKEGQFEVIQGDAYASGNPVAPEDQISYGRVKIAYLTIPKDITKSIIVDQDDSLGKSRIRSHQERLRRVEKKTDWIFNNNAPGRIKYNLTGSSFYDVSASENMEAITVGGTVNGYRLASHTINDYYWSFKDFSGNPPIEGEYEKDNGIASFTEINHEDHSAGICKLQKRTVEDLTYTSNSGNRIGGQNRKFQTWRNGNTSHYPGCSFPITTPTRLDYIAVDNRFYRNAASVRLDLYTFDGSKGQFIADGGTKDLRGYPSRDYGIIQTEVFKFYFGDLTLQPGWYYWMLVIEPKYKNTPADTWINTIKYPGRQGELMSFQGQFPPLRSGKGIQYRFAEIMLFDIVAWKDVLSPEGTILSSMIDTT